VPAKQSNRSRPVLLDIQDKNRVTGSKYQISSDIRTLVTTQAVVYSTYVRRYIPNTPFLQGLEGYESKTKQGREPQSDLYETNEERSIRRTRAKIKDLVDSNDFEWFGTFTFDQANVDRYSVSECKRVMRNWLKNQRARNGKFRYVIVAEHHKDGALHFHTLIGGYTGKLTPSINPTTGTQISQKGRLVFNFLEYKSGYSSAIHLDDLQETRTKIAFYVQKYITKDMPIIFGKNRYWASHGLKRPLVINNPGDWFTGLNPQHVQQLDYGRYEYYDRKQVEAYLP